jgi:enoyl-CoA hydratase
MDEETGVSFEVDSAGADDGAVVVVTISRPESLNALSPGVLLGLELAFDQLEQRKGVRVVIIRGSGGKAFVAGADIKVMASLEPSDLRGYLERGQRVMRRIERFAAPVIAAVTGFALGGGMELALACDLIASTETSRFGQPEVNLGLIPGFGGTQRLAHRGGWGTARRLIYTGEIIMAAEAHRLGLVDFVWSTDDFDVRLRELAGTIAAKAPTAVAESKRVMRETRESWELAGLQREVEAFAGLMTSSDCREGFSAFLEKRSPQFKGA